MSSYIFLVGKSDPHLEAAAAIRKLGYQVGIFQDKSLPLKHPEAFDKIIPIDFEALDTELARLETIAIAGLVCTYENYVIAKAKIGEHFDLETATIRSAEMSTDKYLMRSAFSHTDPSITPGFAKVSSEEELMAFAEGASYPLILKPTNLVKSLLVLRCDNQQELRQNFAYAQTEIVNLYEKYNIYDREPQLIVEEFIKGKSCSIAAFIDSNGIPHFCDGIVAITTAKEHGANDNYLYSRRLPLECNDTLSQRLFEVAEIGIKALEMKSTPAHVELMYDGNDVKIIEIGARIGGYRPRMYNFSYGLNLIQQEVRLAIGAKPELTGDFIAYSAVFELFPDKEGSFKQIRGLDDPDKYAYFSIKPQPGTHIGPAKNGYKAAAIVVIAEKNKQRFDELCRSVDTLRVEVEE